MQLIITALEKLFLVFIFSNYRHVDVFADWQCREWVCIFFLKKKLTIVATILIQLSFLPIIVILSLSFFTLYSALSLSVCVLVWCASHQVRPARIPCQAAAAADDRLLCCPCSGVENQAAHWLRFTAGYVGLPKGPTLTAGNHNLPRFWKIMVCLSRGLQIKINEPAFIIRVIYCFLEMYSSVWIHVYWT